MHEGRRLQFVCPPDKVAGDMVMLDVPIQAASQQQLIDLTGDGRPNALSVDNGAGGFDLKPMQPIGAGASFGRVNVDLTGDGQASE